MKNNERGATRAEGVTESGEVKGARGVEYVHGDWSKDIYQVGIDREKGLYTRIHLPVHSITEDDLRRP